MGWRRPDASEGVENRRAQVPRQVIGLVESALPLFPPMQWDWDDEVGSGEQVHPRIPHQGCQGAAQRTSSVVFEGVNDRPQGVLVSPNTEQVQSGDVF